MFCPLWVWCAKSPPKTAFDVDYTTATAGPPLTTFIPEKRVCILPVGMMFKMSKIDGCRSIVFVQQTTEPPVPGRRIRNSLTQLDQKAGGEGICKRKLVLGAENDGNEIVQFISIGA